MTSAKLTAVLLAVVPALAAAHEPSLYKNDAALISFIKRDDYVLSAAMSTCTREKLVRGTDGEFKTFEYTATCRAKKAHDSDCPGYTVVARGTVDTEDQATIRSLKLELQCFG